MGDADADYAEDILDVSRKYELEDAEKKYPWIFYGGREQHPFKKVAEDEAYELDRCLEEGNEARVASTRERSWVISRQEKLARDLEGWDVNAMDCGLVETSAGAFAIKRAEMQGDVRRLEAILTTEPTSSASHRHRLVKLQKRLLAVERSRENT